MLFKTDLEKFMNLALYVTVSSGFDSLCLYFSYLLGMKVAELQTFLKHE
jgi:hypothetical protein